MTETKESTKNTKIETRTNNGQAGEGVMKVKITCDCGNEMKFNTIDKETGKEAEVVEDEGQYATADKSKYSFWEQHDVVGISCEQCDKAIWFFT